MTFSDEVVGEAFKLREREDAIFAVGEKVDLTRHDLLAIVNCADDGSELGRVICLFTCHSTA